MQSSNNVVLIHDSFVDDVTASGVPAKILGYRCNFGYNKFDDVACMPASDALSTKR